MPLWVSANTSQSWAMRCIQVPVFETSCPAMKSRKLRMFRDRKVVLTALCALKGGPLGRTRTVPDGSRYDCEPTSLATLTSNGLFPRVTLTARAPVAIRGFSGVAVDSAACCSSYVVSEPTEVKGHRP